MDQAPLPLSNTRIIEFSHMVMGPTCGMVLADLGADMRSGVWPLWSSACLYPQG